MQKPSGLPVKKIGVILVVLIIAVIIVIGGFWFFNKQKISSAPQTSEAEIQDIVAKVGKLMNLPSDETPAIATVSDVTKLDDQDFFKNAKNGDKVLAYSKNKKAIIFRPSENKIIEVAFYNPPVGDKSQASGSAQQEVTKAPTGLVNVNIVIYNGTKTAGLAKSKGNEIVSTFSEAKIVSTGNAAGDFKETLVIDLTGKNKIFAETLANNIKGKVGKLPNGEEKPEADILVILGGSE